MPKSFLFVVNNTSFFESHRLPVALKLISQGHEVHLAAPGESSRVIKESSIIFHDVKFSRSGMNPLLEFFVVLKLYRLFLNIKPDVIHLVTMKPNLYGSFAARFTGVSSVVNAISGLGNLFTGGTAKHRLILFFLKPFFKFAFSYKNQRIIFQNPSDQEDLVLKGFVEASKCVIIPGSGVDLKKYPVVLRPNDSEIVVTFASRLLRDKGVWEFVKVSQLIKRDYPDVKFLLAGDRDPGNPESVSVYDVETWKAQGDVNVLGYRKDIPELFACSDIVVLPSYREGLPKILLEAQACARAVVTTDAPGCRDAILNDKTGLLVPVKDIEALRKAIETLVKDDQLRVQMGMNGRELCAKNFSIERIIELHLKTYSMLTDLN